MLLREVPERGSEFEALVNDAGYLAGKVALADLQEDDSYRDLTFVSKELVVPFQRVEYLVLAHKLQGESGIEAAFFYALLRRNTLLNTNTTDVSRMRLSIDVHTRTDVLLFDAALTERTLHPRGRALRELGERRVQEARAAARVLGVPADRQVFLGYPDGGLRALNGRNYARPYTSPRTGSSAVYLREAQTPGAPFTGQALDADLERVLRRVRPDMILIPAHEDFHPDHHTLTLIAQRLASRLGLTDRLRYWVVHGGLEWPLPKGLHTALPLVPPPLARALPWQRVPLTAGDQQVKAQAVNAYRTQTEVLGRFMRAFVRRNELLSPADQPGR